MASMIEHTKEGIKAQVWGEDSILETLQHELIELKEKIHNARIKGDFGTYKNLIQAFEKVVYLVHEEEDRNKWIDMYSHYYEGNDAIKGENEYLATWKQRGEDIKDHRIFKIEKEVSTLKINFKLGQYEIKDDTLTIPIQVGDKYNCSIKGKRVGDVWVLDNGNTIKCN